ncbi:hypothetical protein OROHE_021656 [Orobanche hederae]
MIEWDQPPVDMRPPGSILFKDYTIETRLERSPNSSGGDSSSEVKIEFNTSNSIASINFVLKDEETVCFYQHRGRDFKVPLINHHQDDDNVVGAKSSDVWPGGASGQLSNLLLKIRHNREEDKNELHIETDLPGDVVVHWGVCRDEGKNWEVPEEPYPPETIIFKNKALRTRLQQKKDGRGSLGLFTLDGEFSAFLFVLKLDNDTWFNCKGDDFCIPITTNAAKDEISGSTLSIGEGQTVTSESKEVVSAYAGGIINEINKLVSGIATEKSRKSQSRKAQKIILEEIEKLAAEAYSIIQSSTPIFTETDQSEDEDSPPPVVISSGTGSGFKILCQGFNGNPINWEDGIWSFKKELKN